MKWEKYTIQTTTQAEDFVSSMLADLGVEGVQIEDNIPLSAEDKEKMYIDILPELPPDDGKAQVSFFLETGQEHGPLLEQIKEELESLRLFVEIGEGTIAQGETEDKDWINNWKQYFKAFTIENILIKPTWEPLPEYADGHILIEIDPGTSFGTGKHETTQLCIRQLCRHLKEGDRVLDVGCGSGILSLVCLKLGASHVTGTDIDPICIQASLDNRYLNRLPEENSRFLQGNLIEDSTLQEQVGQEYDIVAANILADVIIPLTPVIPHHLKKGGIYITSGIIDFKEEAVKDAIQNAGLTILEVTRQGEWVSITAENR
ncbi:ribosomal protein L11 methyltransferase [Eubacterium sp. 14-2]|uniref:50S ribosomal protein L11 methyltransferase n=1 Tax=Eubacterium sp. 14-2 TaxID=1235790 RepID=UPI00033B0EEB|nr:50S ribosomal protein L11 methyltransferase [Eubacterium sp. 14-2]EOT25468.1 ribosomal protein L11 methyltransferase [Eubacterium sp. 14-2]